MFWIAVIDVFIFDLYEFFFFFLNQTCFYIIMTVQVPWCNI